ncbi:uncharacterized protein LOC133819036 [Humulus lupulus]|uniref:uncharacterized protein LOC133819036 n=1 Tax=Humulus lupulus TaxID=3486 RepID=UPI002B407FBD|nr:uncharacterized protein LOC133819036 [Humulus lupulus]
MSARIFQRVMDIPDGDLAIDLQEKVPKIELKAKIFAGSIRIQLSILERNLVNYEEADEYFMASFILVIIGSILVPGFGPEIRTSYINAVSDPTNIRHHNWVAHEYSALMKSIEKYQASRMHHINVCTIFLQAPGNTVEEASLNMDNLTKLQCQKASLVALVEGLLEAVSLVISREIKLIIADKVVGDAHSK